LLHLVGSSILLYLIDDARSNKNQKQKWMTVFSMLIQVTSSVTAVFNMIERILWIEQRRASTTCRTGSITLLQLNLNSYYAEDLQQSLESSRIQLILKGLFRRLSRIPLCIGTKKFTPTLCTIHCLQLYLRMEYLF